jgi:hypothetical protein
MSGRNAIGILVAIAITLGLGYIAWSAYGTSHSEQCYACQRPLHAHMRTVALVNGHPKVFCCPACALSEHEQEGKPIRVTELTDFLTGGKLAPDQAFIVKGSDVNMCATTHEMMGPDKHPAHVEYDRCSPSLLAFGQRSDALQFTREHGGQVQPFSEIASAFAR